MTRVFSGVMVVAGAILFWLAWKHMPEWGKTPFYFPWEKRPDVYEGDYEHENRGCLPMLIGAALVVIGVILWILFP